MLLADFQAGRVYRPARLPIKSPDLYESGFFLFVLLHLRVQRRALFVGEWVVEQAGLAEDCGVERKVLLAHLSEHLLAQPVQLVLKAGDLVAEPLDFGRLRCDYFLFGCHLFRSLSTI